MKKAKFSVLFALLITGMGFQSCAPDDPPENKGRSSSSRGSSNGNSSSSVETYSFCDFEATKECLSGSWKVCPPGATLSNNCHYDISSGSTGDISSNSDASSSSGTVLQEYAFCVYHEIINCSPGPHTSCPGGGELRNDCPYDQSCIDSPLCLVPIEEATVYGEDLIDTRNDETYKTIIIGTQNQMQYDKPMRDLDLKFITGAQIWMASNLNFEPTSATGLSKCYAQGGGNGMDTWLTPEAAKPNCGKYGRLYDWITAMNLPSNCNTASCGSQIRAKHQGICPNGWHIPSREEWNALKDHVYSVLYWNYEDDDYDWDVGTKLKATSGWKDHVEFGNGVDTYGFKAIGSGFCAKCDDASLTSAQGYYSGEETQAHWWSATEYVNQYTNEAKDAYKFEVDYDKNVMTEKCVSKDDYLYSVRCVKD